MIDNQTTAERPRGQVYDDEWRLRLANSLPPEWPDAKKRAQVQLQLADLRPALKALLADAERMRECLMVMSSAEGVGTGSLKTAAYDVVLNCVTADVLRTRFSR